MTTLESIVEVKEEKRASVVVLRFTGRLDAVSSPTVERQVFDLIHQKEQFFLFDFSEVSYLSSAGMRMLLAVTKKLKSISGKLVVCSIAPNVMDVLKISGFDHVLDISRSEHDGIEKLNGYSLKRGEQPTNPTE